MGGAERRSATRPRDMLLESAHLRARRRAPHGAPPRPAHRGLLPLRARRRPRRRSSARRCARRTLLAELAGGEGRRRRRARGVRGPAPRAAVLVRPARVNALLGQQCDRRAHRGGARGDRRCAGRARATRFEVTRAELPPGSRRARSTSSRKWRASSATTASRRRCRTVAADAGAPCPQGVACAAGLRSLLCGLGMDEHVSVSFTSEADNAALPGLSADGAERPRAQSAARRRHGAAERARSPRCWRAAANVAVQQPRVRPVQRRPARSSMTGDGEPEQREVVAGLLYGPRPGSRGPASTRDSRSPTSRRWSRRCSACWRRARRSISWRPRRRPEFHPRAAAEVLVDGHAVGVLGRLHPDVAEGSEITGEIYLFEVDCREAVAYRRAHPGLQPIPRYPSSERDVSLLRRPRCARWQQPSRAVEELRRTLHRVDRVFDEYTGAGNRERPESIGLQARVPRRRPHPDGCRGDARCTRRSLAT